MFFKMGFDLGTVDSGERLLPFGLPVFFFFVCLFVCFYSTVRRILSKLYMVYLLSIFSNKVYQSRS